MSDRPEGGDGELATPAQTERELRQVRHELGEATRGLRGHLVAASAAEYRYKVELAKAQLSAPGETVGEREANAFLAEVMVDGVPTDRTVADLFQDWQTKKAIASAAREAIRSLRDQLSAVQSENANVRAASGLAAR